MPLSHEHMFKQAAMKSAHSHWHLASEWRGGKGGGETNHRVQTHSKKAPWAKSPQTLIAHTVLASTVVWMWKYVNIWTLGSVTRQPEIPASHERWEGGFGGYPPFLCGWNNESGRKEHIPLLCLSLSFFLFPFLPSIPTPDTVKLLHWCFYLTTRGALQRVWDRHIRVPLWVASFSPCGKIEI